MLDYFPIILIAYHWLHLLWLFEKYSKRKEISRRWFVKPHLTDRMRDVYGAYQTVFLYFANYDGEEFYRMTRMTVNQFQRLYEIVGPRLVKTSLRRPLPPQLRLALTITYLAHGDSQWTTAIFFRVGKSTAYEIIAEVCPLIWELLSPTYLPWKNSAQWKIVAQGFRVKWGFPNCIGALDGKEIRIKASSHSGSLYYNYKKFHSFKLLSICDAYYRFTWVDIGDYGSVSDESAFQNTHLFQALETGNADIPGDGILPRSNIRLPHFFIGDAIFPRKRYMMKPFARHNNLTEKQRVFNYRLSRARNCIEDTFGILSARWQILQDRLNVQLETSIAIVRALVCLHNFIITDEHLQRVPNRLYGVPVTRGRNREDPLGNEVINEEENVPADVEEQREMLANRL